MKHTKKITTRVKQSLSAQIEKLKAEFLILVDADFYFQLEAAYPKVKSKI